MWLVFDVIKTTQNLILYSKFRVIYEKQKSFDVLFQQKYKECGIHLQMKLAKANKSWTTLTLSKRLYESSHI